ncbi:MAG TPA: VanZ family protein [Bacillales bacterium]|nr:VanZ family protein [Bacillales bacterium]
MQVENKAFIRMRWKRFGFYCLFAYGMVLVYLTLFIHNYYTYGRSVNLQLFDSIELMMDSGNGWLVLKNVIGNVLLFLPFGLLLPFLFRKCRNFFIMFVVSAGFSFLIEITQYKYAKRIFDIDDIFLNVIGALIGWFFALVVRDLLKRVTNLWR